MIDRLIRILTVIVLFQQIRIFGRPIGDLVFDGCVCLFVLFWVIRVWGWWTA